ncbi:MAG: AAA family ATPase [Alistipes sp.]|nr:AAA family ATPase [Alistipes sp.]
MEQKNTPNIVEGLHQVVSDAVVSTLKDTQFSENLQIVEGWRKYRIKVTDTIQEPQPIIKQGDKIVVSRGNILTVQGRAKTYKTFLVSGMVAAALDEGLGMNGTRDVSRVLYVDTEQSDAHTQIVLKRIYRLLDMPLDTEDDSVIMLALRKENATERLSYAIQAIEELRPDLVVIDGVRDLVADFNSIDESSKVVGKLMELSAAYNCAIVTIIHQNKGDNNARGHLGTELMNKSETVLQVVRDRSVATVAPIHCRNIEVDEFSFTVIDGLPQLCDKPKDAEKRQELEDLFSLYFGDTIRWRKSELIAKMMIELKRSEKTARRKIAEAIELGILVEDSEKRISAPSLIESKF